jgi:UPF0716 family protein affecting phage T7 exclusion
MSTILITLAIMLPVEAAVLVKVMKSLGCWHVR